MQTFFKIKNVWKIKKTLKNVKKRDQNKKNVKNVFYIYESHRGRDVRRRPARGPLLRMLHVAWSVHRLFGTSHTPGGQLRWVNASIGSLPLTTHVYYLCYVLSE